MACGPRPLRSKRTTEHETTTRSDSAQRSARSSVVALEIAPTSAGRAASLDRRPAGSRQARDRAAGVRGVAPRTREDSESVHVRTHHFRRRDRSRQRQVRQRTIKFETGLLARQAAGSVTAYLDDETMLLSATTAGKHPKEQFDFFPLTIDVEERMYAVGQIPGSFFRSEGRPGEDAILTCRLIDRPLRPTFKKGLRNEVQVVITVLALDPDQPYDVLAINAASHVHPALRPAVLRPGRRRPRRPHRGPVGRLPVATASSRTPSSTWSSPAGSPRPATSRS